jgi:hypothetical protein
MKLFPLSFFWVVFLSFSPLAESESLLPKINGKLVTYEVDGESWSESSLSVDGKIVNAATLLINFKSCDHKQFPIKINYKSEPLRHSYSNYYKVSSRNDKLALGIYNFSFGNINASFESMEFDLSFLKCIKKVDLQNTINHSFVLKDTAIKNDDDDIGKYKNKKNFVFNKYLDEKITLNSDQRYIYQDFVRESALVKSEVEQGHICDPKSMTNKFEDKIINRPLVCGITKDLAEHTGYSMSENDVLTVSGEINSGAIFISLVRKGGGLIDVVPLTIGKVDYNFKVPSDGIYQVLLSTNLMIYNYPFLSFDFSLTHSYM